MAKFDSYRVGVGAPNQSRAAIIAFALIASLSACSGGDGSSSPQVPTAPNLASPAASQTATRGVREAKPNTSPYVYVTSTPAPSAEAWCPTGDKAIGGGFNNPNSGSTTVESHYVGSLHRPWKSVDAGGGNITSTAICVATAFVTTNYVSQAWSDTEGAVLSCGSGYEFSGGGFIFNSSEPGANYPLSSTSWTVLSNADFSSSGTAYGVCTQTSNYTYVSASASNDSRANCPSGDVVVGGGFLESNPASANAIVISSNFYNSHQTWRVQSSGNTFAAYAVCAPDS